MRDVPRQGFVFVVVVVAAALTPLLVRAFDQDAVAQLDSFNHCAGCDLSAANLRDKGLVGAGLAGANLSGANLIKANLIGANLSGADLTDADLTGALLADADLTGTDLTGATLDGTRLGGANLTQTRGLNQSQLDVACDAGSGSPYLTQLPPGLHLPRCR